MRLVTRTSNSFPILFLFLNFASQDPVKVVNKVVENITLANPDFNNPVGNFVYTMW